MTKTQLIQILSDRINVNKQQATLFLETLGDVAAETLDKDGKFVIPDLVKFTLKNKAATPERQGVNPFTKTPMTIPAKPASKKVATSAIGDLKKRFVA